MDELVSVAPATSSSIPMDFDLLMQSNGSATKPTAAPSTTTDVSGLLVPMANPPAKGLSVNVNEKQSGDNDVLMLGGSENNTDDVQLLHSPPLVTGNSTPSIPATAPTLADILLKFEEIKPSKIHYKYSNIRILLSFFLTLFLGSKSPIPLLSQESGLNVNLLSASAQVPKVRNKSPYLGFLSGCVSLTVCSIISLAQNVSVFVVLVTNCNPSPLTNITFQAIVPKVCTRIRLLNVESLNGARRKKK